MRYNTPPMHAPTSRRRFLKNAAFGGGGVLLGSAGLNALSPLIFHRPVPIETNGSFWALSQPAQNQPLQEDLTVDVAIIGGGFTGLSSAYFIRTLSPGKRVAVLEARGCGNGASGRNGAMLLTMTADRYVDLSSDPQLDQRLYELTSNNIRFISTLSAATGVDCELENNGALQVYARADEAEMAREYVRRARLLGMPVEYWDAPRVRAAIGTEAYEGAFFDPRAGQLHPMKLVHVFKTAAESAGAEIYENTTVDHIEEGATHTLTTGDGRTVRAKSLVLATNAFTANIGYLKNSIVPLREYQSITRPLSAQELTDLGWHSRAPFNDSRTLVYYFGLTREGRVHIGGGSPRYDFDNRPAAAGSNEAESAKLQRELHRVFPSLAGIQLETTWNGLIDWSLDASPSVGVLGKNRNVFYGLGYSGHGVNLTSIFGRIIADLEAGRAQSWERYPFLNARLDYVPNEPFRWAAAKLGTAWYELTERPGK